MKKFFSNNKIITIVCFLFLLIVHFCFGNFIYAYLTNTDEVKAAFTIASDGLLENLSENFLLLEHKAIDSNKDASYELTDEEVLSNDYVVYPGVNIPKDPFVRIIDLQDTAYLYIEIVGENNEDFKWDVTNKWLKTDLTGSRGGTIYVYSDNGIDAYVLSPENETYFEAYILKDINESINGGIEISDNYTNNKILLKFYGYLAQEKGFDNYIEAFESCF